MQLLAEIKPRAPFFVDEVPLVDELITQLAFGIPGAFTACAISGTSTMTSQGIALAAGGSTLNGAASLAAMGQAQAMAHASIQGQGQLLIGAAEAVTGCAVAGHAWLGILPHRNRFRVDIHHVRPRVSL